MISIGMESLLNVRSGVLRGSMFSWRDRLSNESDPGEGQKTFGRSGTGCSSRDAVSRACKVANGRISAQL